MSKTFNNIMKSIGDNFINEGRRFLYEMGFFNRPIGILSKNYGFVMNTLFRNIGNGFHNFDGYGSPIGTLADVEMNAYSKPPWFFIDMKKNATSNYLEYINSTYFNGNGIVNNFVDSDVKTSFFDYNTLLLDNAKVGAVRYYDIDNVPSSINGDNIQTNPNAPFDTKLGALNNFYLNATLHNSRNVYEERLENNASITSGVYTNFGFDGDFGMENGDIHNISGRVMTNSELVGDFIPWSTTDHTYNSYIVGGGGKGNLKTVQNIFNLSTDKDLSIHYTDNAKDTTVDNLYYPFGNFYSITYSLGLTSSSGYKTKEFIAKSMLGYDLLGNDYVDVEFNNIDQYAPKKYYVGNGTRGSNYIDAMSGTDAEFIKYNGETNSNVVRLSFPDMGNDNLWSTRALYTYAENEGGTVPSTMGDIANTFNLGTEYGRHITYNSGTTSEKKDIIYYTNKRFQEGDYDTLISRFHSDYIGLDGSRGNRDVTSTSVSKYGMSHGRNLLKVKPTNENGYNNPYCRTWTYHHQYSTLKDVIRPFDNLDLDTKLEDTGVYAYRTTSGLTKLKEYGVKGDNGLVQIAPTKEDNVKRCMFSIENLAWKGEKDFFEGHKDQKGPLGGRIMWFPPYDIKFNENVSVNWSSNQFIGRGESIYTYTNTERSGTLSFKLLIDHPSIVNQWRGEVRGGDAIGDVDDINSNEQQLLRFFAGCELLKAQKPEVKNEPKVTTIKPKVKEVSTPITTYDELVFYVFYPNNYSGVDDAPDGIVKPMEYLINGIGPNKYIHEETNTKNKRIEDYGTTLSTKLYGYEMGNGGISTTSASTQDTFTKTEILTTKNGVNIGYQYCQNSKNGKPNFWGYRCDKTYENQVLHTYSGHKKINYYDCADYSLNNTTGYTKLIQAHTNDNETLIKGRLFSFADVFCAIQPEAKGILSGKYDDEQVNIITDILGINKKGYSVVGIDVKGFASSHGYTASNDVLGRNRGKSVVKWLNKCFPEKFSMDVFTYDINEIGDKLSDYNSNSFLAKVWRCSRVAIKIQKEEIITTSEIIDMPLSGDSGFNNITYADNMISNEIQKSRSLADLVKPNNLYDLSLAYVNQFGQHLSDIQLKATVNQIENNKAEAEADAMSANEKGNTISISESGKYGYRHEYEFFTELEKEAPFLHSKIVQKLKYFDPAFHSITPEGFQSRLTFLHQCTRQGNTVSASDNSVNRTANNLAFGKPPVCVLRIGDFYNTKIIIESLTIDYDDTTWDLNDEGIGVMPMMANINISFKFLGGSDLSGPINRLQNALSFNHYANTSVYDSRAEEVVYDSEGKIKDFRYKPE